MATVTHIILTCKHCHAIARVQVADLWDKVPTRLVCSVCGESSERKIIGYGLLRADGSTLERV